MPRDVADVGGRRTPRRQCVDEVVVGGLHRVHPKHPIAVGGDAPRQPVQAPHDRGEVAGEVGEVGGAGGGDEAGGQQSGQLGADVGDRLGLRGRRLVGQREPHLAAQATSTFSTRPTTSSVVATRAFADPVPQARANSARVHTGVGHQHVDRGVGAVIEQRRQRAVGVGAEHQPGPGIQRPLNGFHR